MRRASGKDIDVSTEARTPLETEGPLRRWARRKREAALEKKTADEERRSTGSVEAPEPREPNGENSEPVVTEERVLTDEDMPPLASLDENSDYSGFLSSGVSEGLRRRALRKLFLSSVFNIRDGLDDYDEDFTSFEALGDIVTSDMRHQAEVEADRARHARAEPEPATALDDESGEAEEERQARAEDEPTDPGVEGPVENEESVADGLPLAGAESPDAFGAANRAGDAATEGGVSARTTRGTATDVPVIATGDSKSAGTEAPANNKDAEHRDT